MTISNTQNGVEFVFDDKTIFLDHHSIETPDNIQVKTEVFAPYKQYLRIKYKAKPTGNGLLKFYYEDVTFPTTTDAEKLKERIYRISITDVMTKKVVAYSNQVKFPVEFILKDSYEVFINSVNSTKWFEISGAKELKYTGRALYGGEKIEIINH